MIEHIERVTGIDKRTLYSKVASDDVKSLFEIIHAIDDTGIHWYAKNALRLRLGAYSVNEVRGMILNDLYTEYNKDKRSRSKDKTRLIGFVLSGLCLVVLLMILLKVWLHLFSIM